MSCPQSISAKVAKDPSPSAPWKVKVMVVAWDTGHSQHLASTETPCKCGQQSSVASFQARAKNSGSETCNSPKLLPAPLPSLSLS
ncbi:hypothetical protein MDA_GLEAN10006511 [Myotis davidii]|uniref:Uncharacterized protein n=1 Tax=Myotis davidii TaxID=225400 RepID=L5LQP9_MYODS|nr:hypothetical protein MDA_GLEAN10006511 [Myotis davidii]